MKKLIIFIVTALGCAQLAFAFVNHNNPTDTNLDANGSSLGQNPDGSSDPNAVQSTDPLTTPAPQPDPTSNSGAGEKPETTDPTAAPEGNY